MPSTSRPEAVSSTRSVTETSDTFLRRSAAEVVGSVSSEAVDLVDDYGVDVALLEDAVEHGLEPGSVGRVLGAGVVVDVLIDHGPALLADELEAGFPLGRE
jgi:hypothetical protein